VTDRQTNKQTDRIETYAVKYIVSRKWVISTLVVYLVKLCCILLHRKHLKFVLKFLYPKFTVFSMRYIMLSAIR